MPNFIVEPLARDSPGLEGSPALLSLIVGIHKLHSSNAYFFDQQQNKCGFYCEITTHNISTVYDVVSPRQPRTAYCIELGDTKVANAGTRVSRSTFVFASLCRSDDRSWLSKSDWPNNPYQPRIPFTCSHPASVLASSSHTFRFCLTILPLTPSPHSFRSHFIITVDHFGDTSLRICCLDATQFAR